MGFLVEGEVNELSGDMMTGKPFDCTEFCIPKEIGNKLEKFRYYEKAKKLEKISHYI
jgi:hypothetical protein